MLDTIVRIIRFWWQNTGEEVIEEGIATSTCGLHIQPHKQDKCTCKYMNTHYTCISDKWG